ncbi:hypothetical protein [Streptomyces sp. NPDC002564]|uniref:hypothetical protein n=1 Tax=Streptomyces sp. NPDC002564 TaxID=3364649 RepID=UPI0036B7CF8E
MTAPRVDGELISRNPCRIEDAGEEVAAERRIDTVEQVDALADAVGPRWWFVIYLGASGPMRPEAQAGPRRRDVDLENLDVGVVVLPEFLRREAEWYLDW